jgi:putative transposase
VTSGGKKEFLAIEDGYRESEQSWTEVLLSLKGRVFKSPNLTVGDGALGFWKAIRKVFSQTPSQRCWVNKAANILNKLPKHSQAKAKQYIHDIWMAETRENTEKAFDLFIKTYQLKYPKATQCLEKDRAELLAFYDFPADRWTHIRSSNPIESTFSKVRLRTKKTRACVSRSTILPMVYKLGLSAEKGWRKLR